MKILIHPYSFVYLGLDCRGNSLRRGSPDLPLPSHFLQLTWGTTETFPGFPLRCTLFNVSWVYLRAHSIQNTILVRCPNHLFDDSLCYISHSLEKIHSQFPLFVSAIAFFKSLQRAYDHKWRYRCISTNWQLHLHTQLSLYQNRLVQYVGHCRNPSVSSTLPSPLTHEHETKTSLFSQRSKI